MNMTDASRVPNRVRVADSANSRPVGQGRPYNRRGQEHAHTALDATRWALERVTDVGNVPVCGGAVATLGKSLTGTAPGGTLNGTWWDVAAREFVPVMFLVISSACVWDQRARLVLRGVSRAPDHTGGVRGTDVQRAGGKPSFVIVGAGLYRLVSVCRAHLVVTAHATTTPH